MFDSGSDLPFVTNECTRRMEFKVVGRELLNYTCFGENLSEEEEKEDFELNFEGKRIHFMSIKHINLYHYVQVSNSSGDFISLK